MRHLCVLESLRLQCVPSVNQGKVLMRKDWVHYLEPIHADFHAIGRDLP